MNTDVRGQREWDGEKQKEKKKQKHQRSKEIDNQRKNLMVRGKQEIIKTTKKDKQLDG